MAVSYQLLILGLVLAVAPKCEGQAIMEIIPSEIYLETDSTNIDDIQVQAKQVQFKCMGLQEGGNVEGLSMKRNLTSISSNHLSGVMGSQFQSQGNGVPELGSIFSGRNATINSTDNLGRQISVYAYVTCADMGTYECSVTYLQNFGHVIITKNNTFNPVVLPGQAHIYVSDYQALINATIELECRAPVGTVTATTKIKWIWDIRSEDGSWEPYYAQPNEIKKDRDTLKRGCYEIQTVFLTHKLTYGDSLRYYRCYVQSGENIYPKYAAVYRIKELPTKAVQEKEERRDAEEAEIGMIVGIILGLIILIIIIVVIVVFLRRRKAQNEEKPNPAPTPAYTAESGAVTYSQPNRFREPPRVSEKPDPYEPKQPRYANDFNQGRPNQGYDYDNDHRKGGRRYNSDDGGGSERSVSLGHGDPTAGTAI